MSVEELAHLACLSKKQIQQIENGQGSSFYSPTVKYTAAKKVAKLIQLDEKDAFDFGPQFELPFAPAVEVIQNESTSTELPPLLEQVNGLPKKEVLKKEGKPGEPRKVITRKRKADTESTTPSQPDSKPTFVQTPKLEPIKPMRTAMHQQKPSGKKWVWLLPVGALVLAVVQFQPVLRDQLDAMMGKSKPVEVAAPPSAPAVDPVPSNPPATEATAAPAPAAPVSASPVATSSALPVTAASGCPPADGAMESYKPPSAGKPGNLVFVTANTAQLVCVIDAGGVAQSKTLEPGLGHSFYGKPPFKVFTPGFASVEVYFQGFRVQPSALDAKNILLVQAD